MAKSAYDKYHGNKHVKSAETRRKEYEKARGDYKAGKKVDKGTLRTSSSHPRVNIWGLTEPYDDNRARVTARAAELRKRKKDSSGKPVSRKSDMRFYESSKERDDRVKERAAELRAKNRKAGKK